MSFDSISALKVHHTVIDIQKRARHVYTVPAYDNTSIIKLDQDLLDFVINANHLNGKVTHYQKISDLVRPIRPYLKNISTVQTLMSRIVNPLVFNMLVNQLLTEYDNDEEFFVAPFRIDGVYLYLHPDKTKRGYIHMRDIKVILEAVKNYETAIVEVFEKTGIYFMHMQQLVTCMYMEHKYLIIQDESGTTQILNGMTDDDLERGIKKDEKFRTDRYPDHYKALSQ